MLRFFRTPGLPQARTDAFASAAERLAGRPVGPVASESCFYIEEAGSPLSASHLEIVRYLLAETFQPEKFGPASFLENRYPTILEHGPRLEFETAWSSAAVEICRRSGVDGVKRIERSTRLGLSTQLPEDTAAEVLALLYDRMTEMQYRVPLTSFESGLAPKPVRQIRLLEEGLPALLGYSQEYGCGWDGADLEIISGVFHRLGRNPTDVELFQIAQANSEHSRHWVFKGELWVDGKRVPEKNLMQMVKQPLEGSGPNSVIAFCDDSSAIRGKEVEVLVASGPLGPSALETESVLLHPTLTAETHNFPSGVAPYPGAATGGGGRIRDNQAVGRGGSVCASGAAYCVGNLHIPGYSLPWEEDGYRHPSDLASPLDILIQASNGASDYGNCFGEPLIYGFTRSFGLDLPDGYRSWYKPIMYSAGAGQIRDEHIGKHKPARDMLVVQVGGPAYRIGMGGGAASSMEQGKNLQDLDFNAVQRGDPEMEQRVNRLMRACQELGANNPILSAHDLGAGGDCNALPEIVEPAGAVIDLRAIPVGDQTLSVLEIWGNESQERNALLIALDSLPIFETLATRENVPLAVVGRVTGDGILVVHDSVDDTRPVELPLDDILGQLPPKRFDFERVPRQPAPLVLPPDSDFRRVLEMLLRLPSVGSKRFLTNKVDLDVTGLVVQRQLVGPRHLPLSDYALIAQTYADPSGTALSLGEQPLKGLLSPGAGARMAVAEALLNLAGVKITGIADIKCSANWMLAVRQPGEGAWLYDAACALREILLALGVAIDGGKDSLSMASRGHAPDGSTALVKAPAELVIAPYALVEDMSLRVTSDLKRTGDKLFLLSAGGKQRLGGSALGQVLSQLGDEAPDIDDPARLKALFEATQEMVAARAIAACHDVSDGGLIVALLEMAFAGNKGWDLSLAGDHLYASLFSEEAGVVVEVRNQEPALEIARRHGVNATELGRVQDGPLRLEFNGGVVLDEPTVRLHATWEETSYQLERLQQNSDCADQEWQSHLSAPATDLYKLSFDPDADPAAGPSAAAGRRAAGAPGTAATTGPAAGGAVAGASPAAGTARPRAAILREEGSNGDREMAASFLAAGFEPWDVTMTDLLSGDIGLDGFQVVAFVGGFAFADVLDSAKGWASVIRNHERLSEEFERYFARPDTLSLGVCNGCQLMALLGIPGFALPDPLKPRFIRNTSGRFESRFTTVRIEKSPSLFLQGMEGSVLGVWVAHGEGRLHVPDPVNLDWIVENRLAPIRYVDPSGGATTTYPYNPNGSPLGIAALSSPDGRHLAIMPHPERCFQLRQWPWVPADWSCDSSPWLRLFRNAYAAVS
jgi:phosphoribosylformylglycinamidine synthase